MRGYASELAHSLVDDFNVKAIVVACNTATAAGLDDLRDGLEVPIFDVVTPGASAVVRASRAGRVGVIGTVGTISSGAYLQAVERASRQTDVCIELSSAACPGFVEFVERGQLSGDEVMVLAERLLAPLTEAKVDTLLLGCTHYPFLARTIGEVMGPDVVLVSSADETAFEVSERLRELLLLREPGEVGTRRFLSSGDVDAFRDLGSALFGADLVAAEYWER